MACGARVPLAQPSADGSARGTRHLLSLDASAAQKLQPPRSAGPGHWQNGPPRLAPATGMQRQSAAKTSRSPGAGFGVANRWLTGRQLVRCGSGSTSDRLSTSWLPLSQHYAWRGPAGGLGLAGSECNDKSFSLGCDPRHGRLHRPSSPRTEALGWSQPSLRDGPPEILPPLDMLVRFGGRATLGAKPAFTPLSNWSMFLPCVCSLGWRPCWRCCRRARRSWRAAAG